MFDGPVRQLGHHSVGGRVEGEGGEEHRGGAEGLFALASGSFLLAPDRLSAAMMSTRVSTMETAVDIPVPGL